MAFWATPRMSFGHLVFALGSTLYILVGIAFQEQGLLRAFGPAYQDYRNRVPMLFPARRKK